MPWIPAKRFIPPSENGLLALWEGRVWLNPPYGRGIERWVARMIGHGEGVMLTFARTDTRWWQQLAQVADVVCFVRGRIHFVAGVLQRPGRRTPRGRPGASNTLFAFGRECAQALARSGLGIVMQNRGSES